MPNRIQPCIVELALKSIIVHTITYRFMEILAFNFFLLCLNIYSTKTSDPLVMARPLFQPIRGLIFALLYAR
jgi:hypothetical protein